MQRLSFFLGAVIIVGVYEVRQSASSSSSAQLVLKTLKQVNCDPSKQILACFKRRYRTFDGTCNNLCKVAQGSAGSNFVRFVPSAFQNGQGPRLASVVQPFLLENARTISNTVFLSTSENAGAAPNFTHMTMAWGSFIDHDFTLTASSQTQGCGTNNEPCPTNNPGCVSISISQANPDDRLRNNLSAQCIPLSRSAQNYGEQINLVSSYMDGSNIYGVSCQEAETVRDRKGNLGLLRVVPLPVPRSDRMPISPPADPGSFCRSPRPSVKPCFLFADFRDNENPTLMTIHILLTREHNRIARFLHNLNPEWDGERLFQEARKIVIAHIQHITYNEWLPTLFSEDVRRQNGILLEQPGAFFTGYDSNEDATTFNSLASAAFRMGHSLIRESFGQFSKDFTRLGEVSVTRFFDPSSLYKLENNGIDGLNLGLVREQAQQFDRNFAEAIHESLVMPGPGDGVVADLLSINIQRGRDHGLAPYVDFRVECGGVANTFEDLLADIDPSQLERIKSSYVRDYNNIDAFLRDIDLYVGGISENPQAGSILGQTFTCIIATAFRRYRLGDRFWYERGDPHTRGFTLEQLDSIRQGSSLAKLICDNSDNVKEIQPRVFENRLDVVHCDDIRSINLNLWKEEPGHSFKLPKSESCN